MQVRVGLLWHSLGSGNLGVRALTLAQLAILDRVAEETGAVLDIVLFANPVDDPLAPSSFETERVRVVETVDMGARDLSVGAARIVRELAGCGFLLDIAEGDSFTDVYGGRRYAKQVASKLLALASRRPLVLAPQTIGPFRGRLRRGLPALLLRQADSVFVRDEASADFARSLSPRASVIASADLAFRLPFERPEGDGNGRVKVGLNVSGLLYNPPAGDNRFRLKASYRRLVDGLIADFSARPDCELHLIAHVAGGTGGDEDSGVCAHLASRHEGVVPAANFGDPRAAKSYIAGMDFFVGARMHACIAAFSAGVALLPLAYTRKATGLFASLGYPYVGDMTLADEEELAGLVHEAFERRQSLVPALDAGNALASERLRPYEARLAELVRGLGA